LFKATVIVKRKPAILDPQGKAAQQGAKLLGFENIKQTRIDKFIRFEIQVEEISQAEEELKQYCDKILTNPNMEEYEFKLEQF
jgi:phosphoribosylformylglycinamidine synthase